MFCNTLLVYFTKMVNSSSKSRITLRALITLRPLITLRALIILRALITQSFAYSKEKEGDCVPESDP